MKTVIVIKICNRLIIILISLTLLAVSCISPFEPDYKGAGDLLVVDGSLIKGLEKQTISITRASSISEPKYQLVENCQVKIMDDSGNEFVFTEESKGIYISNIDDALLNFDVQYKLVFSTPSGETYESEFQRLLKTAPVDSIYCIKANQFIPDSFKYMDGLQFYMDLNAPDDASKYYKWQIKETWEIHATYLISGVYDGKTIRLSYPSDSLFYCYKTQDVFGFFTYSTLNLSHNIVKKIPLHYKVYNSRDMSIKYGVTLRQFALNKDAYDYWHQRQIDLNESGEIYASQPSQLKSNIHNTANPDEKVLGFFWVSSCSEKHLLLRNPFNLMQIADENCKLMGFYSSESGEQLINNMLSYIARTRNFPKAPVYIVFLMPPGNYDFVKTPVCADCRKAQNGGTTQKPDFWE